MKKICFSGAHGVGKSTASYYLTSLLKQKNPEKSIICLEENVRDIAQLTNGNLKHKSFPTLAITNQLFRELKSELLYDIIITDRSLIDYLVYATETDIDISDEYFDLGISHMKTFDHIYFIRPDNEKSKIADDGFRDTDKSFRNEIDHAFRCYFANYQIKFKTIKQSEILIYDYLKDLE